MGGHEIHTRRAYAHVRVGGSIEERTRVPPDYMTRLYQSTTDERGRLLAPPPYYADSVLAFLDEKKKYMICASPPLRGYDAVSDADDNN
ncbi:unnamed protein product [Hydatigera taeniaeformis]|uniref:Auxin-responsive protein n=1 Tax=Hydatigena taeniaeformis TaxID=6205 RepID=A0A0R3WKB1_HYDTA|nr:unnamed protein product [Hydatigera taeniaeformis]